MVKRRSATIFCAPCSLRTARAQSCQCRESGESGESRDEGVFDQVENAVGDCAAHLTFERTRSFDPQLRSLPTCCQLIEM